MPSVGQCGHVRDSLKSEVELLLEDGFMRLSLHLHLTLQSDIIAASNQKRKRYEWK
jgi:hypothetical protein